MLSSELDVPSDTQHNSQLELAVKASTIGPTSALPRSPTPLSREAFTTILTLTEHQPWLKEKQPELITLVTGCDNHAQQLLVCELLRSFTYLDARDFSEAIQRIANYIQDDLGLNAGNCAIAASENGKYADSSHFVVYSLKVAKWNSLQWNTTCFMSSLSGLVSTSTAGNLVIVDEFIGTGETAEKKLNWVKNQLAPTGHNPKIYYAVVAAMEDGLNRIAAQADGIFAAYILKKGITSAYPPTQAASLILEMKKLESRLHPEGRRGKLSRHSLGYKGSESLYSRSNGNTPNNVFPIFWWELDDKKVARQTLLSCI